MSRHALPQHRLWITQPDTTPASKDSPERFDTLLTGKRGLLVERIVSHGHVTPEGEWCDQERDEWVLVLEGHARLAYADGTEVALNQGYCLLIPKHVRHRVTFTSASCVWLAIHAEELQNNSEMTGVDLQNEAYWRVI